MAAQLDQEEVSDPVIPPGFEYLWDWFWELRSLSKGPISWSDLAAWSKLQGNLTSWQIYILRQMDKILITHLAQTGTHYE